ncbi:MAG: PQQ-binding-like beta-propeller repeat protein, partial [Planctomycetales bacterium]
MKRIAFALVAIGLLGTSAFSAEPSSLAEQQDARILKETGVQGGLIVHLGCGDGELTAALAGERFRVHGLSTNDNDVNGARALLRKRGIYGRASVDRLRGNRLPYIDGSINLLVSEDLGEIPAAEVLRVLAPQGTGYVLQDGTWTKTVKPRPDDIDEWTHYLHSPSNNAVARDRVVGPPRRVQWVGGPRYSRHHDKMSSMSAMVTTGGRMFYVFDEAPRVSVLINPEWKLIARDAFNGTVLWKRPITKWHSHLFRLKSGPAQLPRRLVAVGNRVYVTLSIDGPVSALDAATGETIREYKGSDSTEEILYRDGVLFVVAVKIGPDAQAQAKRRGQAWRPEGWTISAFNAESGDRLWSRERPILPNTLAVDEKRVFFHDGESVVCWDARDGKDKWNSEPVGRSKQIRTHFAPTLVLHDDVVLFAGGEVTGVQGGWDRAADRMSGLDAETGKVLWTVPHPSSGYQSPEDVLVVDGLVWAGDTTSGRSKGVFQGRDPRTGKVIRQFEPDVETYWFHHRCYRAKATERFLLTSRAGIEFIDVKKQSWDTNHFVRGACLYGIMPANGLVYAPHHPCACYLEAKLSGLNALAPAASQPRRVVPSDQRLLQGSAFAKGEPTAADAEDWPTLRQNNGRAGQASTAVPTELRKTWTASIGGKLSSPIVADGKLFAASIDGHEIHALNAVTGAPLWKFSAGGRIDSPPTYFKGRVYFGSRDGWVYAVRASDGVLAWRFLAAAEDLRTTSFSQLESVWPVHGNVLIQNG